MIVISLLLIGLFVGVSCLIRGRKRAERIWDLVGFFGSLVATFCGVAWAIWLTNQDTAARERQAVISLLAMARADVAQTMERCAQYMDADDPTQPFYSDEFVDKASMPTSGTLSAALGSEMVLRHMSPATFKVVTAELGLIEMTGAFASIGATTADRRREAIVSGGWYMVIFHALESELDWLRGRATAKARDSMTRYWMAVETKGDSLPGSWRHFRFNPKVRADLMQEGIEGPNR